MAFLEKKQNGWAFDHLLWDEENVIEAFLPMLEKRFDPHSRHAGCGVHVGPDGGFFALADRFWRASLCVFFGGLCRAFWERGAGFPEPWLFNARHSIELHLKGFVHYAYWFDCLQSEPLTSGGRKQLPDILKGGTRHVLEDFYSRYKGEIARLVEVWDSDNLGDTPDIQRLVLSSKAEEILAEVNKADQQSFRFRYPDLKKEGQRHVQELNWIDDPSRTLPLTGLPTESGIAFDALKTINAFHELRCEAKAISEYLDACWSYIGEAQDIIKDVSSDWLGTDYVG